jgi:hypothetical protein
MTCRTCSAEIASNSAFCSNCGAKVVFDVPTFPQTAPVANKKINPFVIVAIVLVGILGITIAAQNAATPLSPIVTETPAETVEPVPVDWAPEGYTQYDEYLAYKFTTDQGKWPCSNCNFWKVTVIANYGCPGGVYAELNMLDSSGTVVEWSNDTVSSLSAGEKAVLVFENYPYDDSLDTGELTQLTCHG